MQQLYDQIIMRNFPACRVKELQGKIQLLTESDLIQFGGAQWLSGRVLDSRPKGRGFKPHRRHCVVSLSKNINPSLVLVRPRKTRPFITERLLMGHKESNQFTSPNESFEHSLPHSNALLQFCLKLERCKLLKAACYPTKCDVINDIKQDILSKYFDVVLSDVALQKKLH